MHLISWAGRAIKVTWISCKIMIWTVCNNYKKKMHQGFFWTKAVKCRRLFCLKIQFNELTLCVKIHRLFRHSISIITLRHLSIERCKIICFTISWCIHHDIVLMTCIEISKTCLWTETFSKICIMWWKFICRVKIFRGRKTKAKLVDAAPYTVVVGPVVPESAALATVARIPSVAQQLVVDLGNLVAPSVVGAAGPAGSVAVVPGVVVVVFVVLATVVVVELAVVAEPVNIKTQNTVYSFKFVQSYFRTIEIRDSFSHSWICPISNFLI